MNFLDRFAAEVAQTDALPERLALLIAGAAFPELAPDEHLRTLDRMAELVGRRLEGVSPGYERAVTLLETFRVELGFTGSTAQYYSVDNSYLNLVLTRRTGLPIMLCLVCVAIGRRLHIQIDGLGFPGHFLARYRDEEGEWLLDPFYGHVIGVDGAATYLSQLFGQGMALAEEMFQPFSPAAWAQRILNNLRTAYLRDESFDMGIRILDYLLLLRPNAPALWRERGLLHHYTLNWEAAVHDFRRYFFLCSQHALVWGSDAAKNTILSMISDHDRQLYAIYQKLQELMSKTN